MSELPTTHRITEEQIWHALEGADVFLPPVAEPGITPGGTLYEVRQYGWKTRNGDYAVRHSVTGNAEYLIATEVRYTDDWGSDAVSKTWTLNTRNRDLHVNVERGNVWDFEVDAEARSFAWQVEEGLGLHTAEESDWSQLVGLIDSGGKHAQRQERFRSFGWLKTILGNRTK